MEKKWDLPPASGQTSDSHTCIRKPWLAHVTHMTESGRMATCEISYNKITWSSCHVIFHIGTDDNEIVAFNAARVHEIVTEPNEHEAQSKFANVRIDELNRLW